MRWLVRRLPNGYVTDWPRLAGALLFWIVALTATLCDAAPNGQTAPKGEAAPKRETVKASPQWQPGRPIEFVIPGTPGGGEKAVRFMADIIAKYNFAPFSYTTTNKPSETGAAAVSYLAATQDPDHTLLITSKTFYTGFLREEGSSLDLALFTPVAAMGFDNFMLFVGADRTDINTMADFLKAVRAKKASGQTWTIAGVARDSDDSLLTGFLRANYKVDISRTAFEGGKDVAKSLVEKKVDSSINVPSEQNEYYKAGKTKPIVIFSAKRLPAFPNVPTLMETGEKFSMDMQRALVGPPGMTPEAQEFYSTLFKKVYDTPEWKEYTVKNCLSGNFMTGPPLLEHWLHQLKLHRIMISVMDIMKQSEGPDAGAQAKR